METFPMTAFQIEDIYPESSVRVSFRNSWTFSAPPDAPDQRAFTLHFTGFKYYLNTDGTIDTTTNATINNIRSLVDFYKVHRLHENFHFTHPAEGAMVCKFNRPLKVPKGVKGGFGTLEDFQIELIEIPGA